MKKQEKGKWAEKEVQACLEALSKQTVALAWHRLPDSHASRNFISAQPADYVAIADGKTYWLEIKETQNPTRLPKAKVSQWGTLYKFHLAGAHVRVLVFQSAHNHWVFLDNDDLFNFEDCPASFLLTGLKTFPTAAKALEEIFG